MLNENHHYLDKLLEHFSYLKTKLKKIHMHENTIHYIKYPRKENPIGSAVSEILRDRLLCIIGSKVFLSEAKYLEKLFWTK